MLYIILYCTVLYAAIKCYTTLYNTIPYNTILYYTIICSTLLHCIVLSCTVLYYAIDTILYYTLYYIQWLNENGYHRLIYLNASSLVCGTIWEGSEGVVLLRRFTEGGLWGLNSPYHSELVFSFSLPCACGPDVRSQPLLQRCACLPTAIFLPGWSSTLIL